MADKTRRDRKWSGEVTQNSDALDLEAGIFDSEDPARIARSLKHSAEHSNAANPLRFAPRCPC